MARGSKAQLPMTRQGDCGVKVMLRYHYHFTYHVGGAHGCQFCATKLKQGAGDRKHWLECSMVVMASHALLQQAPKDAIHLGFRSMITYDQQSNRLAYLVQHCPIVQVFTSPIKGSARGTRTAGPCCTRYAKQANNDLAVCQCLRKCAWLHAQPRSNGWTKHVP